MHEGEGIRGESERKIQRREGGEIGEQRWK